jgi:hypothetical protein
MEERTAAQKEKEAARWAMRVSVQSFLDRGGGRFDGRGFSDRTVKALVARGIDAPERLLFAAETEFRKIPGIGKASVDEIMRYRARFIPEARS